MLDLLILFFDPCLFRLPLFRGFLLIAFLFFEQIVIEGHAFCDRLKRDLNAIKQSLYETLKQKSHYDSLRDQLRFIVKPELRHKHEFYVFQRANATGYNALAPSNWQEVPDLTVANLYHYFKQQESYA